MKYILIFSLILTSCATKKLDLSNSATTYDSVKSIMDVQPRFGFIAYGHKYDFGVIPHTTNGKDYCDYLVGFEDNKMKYFIPEKRIVELKETFSTKIGIEEKSKTILAQIQKLHNEKYECQPTYAETNYGHKKESVVDTVAYLIILSPGIILTAPLWIPAMIADAYKKQKQKTPAFTERLLGKKSKTVYSAIGNQAFDHHNIERFKVDKVYNDRANIMLIFEDDILVGYVSGPYAGPEYLKK